MGQDPEGKMKGCFDLESQGDHVVEQVDHEMEQDHMMEWREWDHEMA